LRRRLIHCQRRTPSYFQARFDRAPPHELEERLHNKKGNKNLIDASNIKTTTRRPVSLTDPNKHQRSVFTTSTLGKDHVSKIRHTT
jgi:hypothetical protein